MGMFDKDMAFAPDGKLSDFVEDEQEFIVWDVEIKDAEFPLDDKTKVPMVHWTVSSIEAPGNKHVVSTIGRAMHEKAKAKSDGDLPAVCVTKHVPSDFDSDAYVLQFRRPYDAKTAAKASA